MTRSDAVNWLYAHEGQGLDFDGAYGIQCFDSFNYFYQFVTGRNPYSDGYGVPGAKDIWNVPTSLFTKIANNPSDPNQVPQPADIMIYNIGQWGHVDMVLSADANSVTTIGQNAGGRNEPMQIVTRSWNELVGGWQLQGWLSYNGFGEAPQLGSNQRIVGANGVNYRDRPTTSAGIIKEFATDDVLDFKGYVRGENVSGIDIWFVGAYTGGYCWAGAFTDSSTSGLPDITPVTPVPTPPPPPTPKPYTFTKDLDCVTEVIPAGTNNFEYGNFPEKPEKVVLHDFGTRGVDTYQSVVNTIKNNGARVVSAHFVVSGKNITQMVSLKDRAYHAGVNGNNFIGIETDPVQDLDTITSVKRLLSQLKTKYGYQFPLVKHSSLMPTACGDDIDLTQYDINPPKPEPTPTPDPKPVEPPANGSESLLEVIKQFINKIISWLSSWKRDKK